MDVPQVGIGLAFLAGFASFLSPCVFPLVPAYVSYLGGASVTSIKDSEVNHWSAFKHGLAFVLGFTFIFVLLGATISAVGRIFSELADWLGRIGGVIVIIFGLHMSGILRIPFLMYDVRYNPKAGHKWGYLSSALMGVFFSAGWSPCIGPVLGAILTLSLSEKSVLLGIILLASYSAGLAIPFLIAAIGIGWVIFIIKRYSKVLHVIEVIMGIVLIIVGTLLMFDMFTYLSRYGSFIELTL
jgi:cytochrome c-type biogenesis protein